MTILAEELIPKEALPPSSRSILCGAASSAHREGVVIHGASCRA